MRLDPARCLPALRRRARRLLCALLPTLVLAATSPPACAAMVTGASDGAPHASHAHDAASAAQHGAMHEGTAHHAPPPLAPACPHCPLDSGLANAGHAACVVTEAQTDDGAAQTVADRSATALPPSWLVPAASVAPPLITAAARAGPPLTPTVPLNLRHCVLLI